MFPFYVDAYQAGAVLEFMTMMMMFIVWFTSLLTGSRC